MTAGHVAHAAAHNAIKAVGVLVEVEPAEFVRIVGKAEHPVVVVAPGGVFRKHVRYLTSYRGLAFHTKSDSPLALPRAELVSATKISLPDG